MVPLVLVMLVVGSQASIPFLGSLYDEVKTAVNVDTVSKGFHDGVKAIFGHGDTKNEDTIFNGIKRVAKQEVVAISQPIESAVLGNFFTKCDMIKRALGVHSTSRKLLRDEELRHLNLQFITSSVHTTFNLSGAAASIPASGLFDSELPLIVFAHGYMSFPDSERFSSLVDAFQVRGKYNVLALDSSEYIFWFYFRATTYVQYIGERLGEVLAAMVQRGLNPKSIHLIGHSLGAHISGFTGKRFTQLTGLRVGRISGLDPAGPCFFNASPDLKLRATDADYVDVIHTSAGTMGLTQPVGHADFYPNGGTQQPDCVTQLCSHELVWKLYAESVTNPEGFVAAKCTSWNQFRGNQCSQERVVMGYGATPAVQGLFFLQTRPYPPYALGETGATYLHSEGLLKSFQNLGP